MNGISVPAKDNISKIVDNLFDQMAIQIIGEVPRLKNKKLAIISMEPHFGLGHLFVQAMQNKTPNLLEQDILSGLLKIADGHIESLKNKTRSNILEAVDAAARTARISKSKLSPSIVEKILGEEMQKARSGMNTIIEAESSKFKNFGKVMTISKMAASVGDDDPTCFFSVRKDNLTCVECKKIHLMPDGVTPRLFKFSDLKQGYHKRGEDTPSICGLHPYCFTENVRLHTTKGLKTVKELFDCQNEVDVFVDKRIKNRKTIGNQFGKSIPGSVWLDRHEKGTQIFHASKVYDTGIQQCVKIVLENGSNIELSENHEMWVDDDNMGVKIKASELKIGDKLPLISGECGFGENHFPELAELMGNLMGDGSIDRNTTTWHFFGNDIDYGKKLLELAKNYSPRVNNELIIYEPDEKYNIQRASFRSTILRKIFTEEYNLSKKPRRVPEKIFSASKPTVAAFLRGLYAADGHPEKSPAITLSQNDKFFLMEIQLLLSNFGITSRIYLQDKEQQKEITYANGDKFITNRKPCWKLLIGGWDQSALFYKEIGFGVPKKQNKLCSFLQETEGRTKLGNWRTSKVISIEKIGEKQTYCLTEPMTNTVTANGIVTGQCRCELLYLTKGFGFNKKGFIEYISRDFDAYEKQKK